MRIVKEKMLAYSTFDPNYGLKDNPKNYIYGTYILHKFNTQIHLEFINEIFWGNEDRMGQVEKGWITVLPRKRKMQKALKPIFKIHSIVFNFFSIELQYFFNLR